MGDAPATASTPAPDNVETRVLACTPCHGMQSRGTHDDYIPRLAGKPAGYLFNQLVVFREGRRHYSPMNYLLELQSDESLRTMAEYFANQNLPSTPRNDCQQFGVGTRSEAGTARGRQSWHPYVQTLCADADVERPELWFHVAGKLGVRIAEYLAAADESP